MVARSDCFQFELSSSPLVTADPRTPELQSALPAALAAVLGDQPLNEMQQAALPAILGGTRNLLVGAKTGAGKTRLAEIALVEAALHGAAGLFLVPMRAIAGEKQAEWKRFAPQGLHIYKTTGDDAAFNPEQAAAAQIVVTTPERLESLIRNRRLGELAARLRVVVVDEVHLVGEGRRGALLEALLTRLRRIMPQARLIAMSGTVPNIQSLADWLDADTFTSNWRPMPIEIHIHSYKPPRGREADETERTTIVALAVGRAIAGGGASIVFCGSRAGVERCALALATEHAFPRQVPRETIERAEHQMLAEVLAGGVGFHHAGLGHADRTLVETLYRDGTLRVLVATSTVAAGVNLPASQVVVRDVRVGHDFMAPSQLLQMCGRPGRIGLVESGEALIITPQRDLAETERALAGAPVESTLGEDLATPLCTEIALGLARTAEQARQWYERTLHGRNPNYAALDLALKVLLDDGFVLQKPDGALVATPLGHATSSLMLKVSTAGRLDRYLRSCGGHADADELEEDLLRTVCIRSDEWGSSVGAADAGTLAGRLGVYDAALTDWAPLRLRALAAATCLLGGISLGLLGLPDSTAAAQTARGDLPRLLGFLARRATERREPLPHLALAAEDLAASLTAALPRRGMAVQLSPLSTACLAQRGQMLWLEGMPEGTRCWVRLSGVLDDYALAPTLTRDAAPLLPLAALGRPGDAAHVVATIVGRESKSWSFGTASLRVRIPAYEGEAPRATICRHDWKTLRAYGEPGARNWRLAHYLQTGIATGAAKPKSPARRRAKPDPAAPPCPTCAGPMTRRTGHNGDFYSCIGYPRCRGTQEIAGTAPSARLFDWGGEGCALRRNTV